MKKRVLKHDIEFFVMLFVISFLFALLNVYDMSVVLSISLVSVLFAGYIAYSGYQLINI